MEQYAAGIVLFNPNLDRLRQNIDAVCEQVKTVYCFDNGSKNLSEIKKMLSNQNYKNVVVIEGHNNLGIATALNKIVEQAAIDGANWILTLDQDSVVCKNMVKSFARYTNEVGVAIICPIVVDVRRKNEKIMTPSDSIEDMETCITSGSFVNIKTLMSVGGFDDWMFIGLVDDEICVRLRQNGYRIIRDNSVVLNHELGNLTPSKHEAFYLKLGEILHCETIKKLSYKREVSAIRLYYATRNMIYLNCKYGKEKIEIWSTKALIKNIIASVIRGQHKLKLIKAVYRGIIDSK